MRLGLGLAITDRIGAPPYNWLQHFVSGQQGYVLLPGRRETLSQDDAGTTPVTAAGQSVGRMADVSGRANHFSQALADNRPVWRIDGTGRPYLEFDGSNDQLASGTITPGSDKVCVVVGLRKRSDAARGIVLETGPGTGLGRDNLSAPHTTAGTYSAAAGGSTVVGPIVSPASYAAPITNVVTMLADIAGDSLILRVNGTQVASSALDQGTGDFLAYAHFFGGRSGGTLSAAIDAYGVFRRYGALPSAGELAQIEAAMNTVTGAWA